MAVGYALEIGYRLVDTAAAYGNERDVGVALRESGTPREEAFVTTKLWNSDHGFGPALEACDESLRALGLDYLDLYLIHWPVQALRAETWEAMAALLKEGKCRAIGVSNYTVRHLKELLATSDVVPAVNQVEFSPFLYQRDLLEFCRRETIQLEAYSPLTRGLRLKHPAVAALAAKHRKSPAQILIRWGLQHDLVVIPKSVREDRIRENSQVFDFALSSEDMGTLDSLDESLHTCWDPSRAP
jgi:diketogulonate reductase-like aldo/keto reductase